ncbi:DUF218 domain protein [Aspergillus flavus]|nr:DUF218 domain protein [Aspergillus flavus]
MSSEASAEDMNLVAEYLGDRRIQDLSSSPSVDCIVICASAILYQAEHLFQVLQDRPSLSKCLVLCGGVGHSTHFMYEAVAQHPRFSQIAQDIHGLPEARVLERILDRFFDRSAITDGGCMILVEDKSTNCGLNASLSRKILDAAGFHDLKTCIIIQDPTMMLRTKASFQKATVLEDSSRFVPQGLDPATNNELSEIWSRVQSRVLALADGDQRKIRPLGVNDVLSHLDAAQKKDKVSSWKVKDIKDSFNKTLLFIQTVSNIIAGAASQAFGPSELCFNALNFVIQA